MGRLTETDKYGNWGLKEIPWENLLVGTSITWETYEALRGALHKLKDYEDTGLSPADVEELRRQQDRWIPVEEQLPEDGTYLCTFVGELVGQEDPFTGMCGIENGIWDEPDCVTAWQPLPESYKGGQNET